MSDPRLTTEEVAVQLRVKTPRTVSRWAAQGIIRADKVGLRWLFTQKDVDDFLASRANVTPATSDRRRRRRAA